MYFTHFLPLLKIGEGGIRTPGGVAPTQTFQVCTLNHSDTSPFRFVIIILLPLCFYFNIFVSNLVS